MTVKIAITQHDTKRHLHFNNYQDKKLLIQYIGNLLFIYCVECAEHTIETKSDKLISHENSSNS